MLRFNSLYVSEVSLPPIIPLRHGCLLQSHMILGLLPVVFFSRFWEKYYLQQFLPLVVAWKESELVISERNFK